MFDPDTINHMFDTDTINHMVDTDNVNHMVDPDTIDQVVDGIKINQLGGERNLAPRMDCLDTVIWRPGNGSSPLLGNIAAGPLITLKTWKMILGTCWTTFVFMSKLKCHSL